MADKLPPVFVVFSSGGHADVVAQLTTNEQRAAKYVEMEHACGWDDAHAEKYEPAVPRCKTCLSFSVLGHSARCTEFARTVAVDGSHYCRWHRGEIKP